MSRLEDKPKNMKVEAWVENYEVMGMKIDLMSYLVLALVSLTFLDLAKEKRELAAEYLEKAVDGYLQFAASADTEGALAGIAKTLRELPRGAEITEEGGPTLMSFFIYVLTSSMLEGLGDLEVYVLATSMLQVLKKTSGAAEAEKALSAFREIMKKSSKASHPRMQKAIDRAVELALKINKEQEAASS